ncbi:hypothetical protein [Promicromonospora sp. NPDC019610]|uniref:hypothetical protein n=1 Tax=Promicromonospora sp. NPDC019610 TaxID=3364405 RepID=UPI0037A15A9B
MRRAHPPPGRTVARRAPRADDGAASAGAPSAGGTMGAVFVLESVWRPAAPTARVWSVLADPRFTWPDWWPGLTAGATHGVVGPDGLAAPGTWAHLRVRSPLGYALRFRLDLRETTAPSDGVAGRARLDVTGDLEGQADVTVADTPAGTPSAAEVRLLWQVSPGPPWFRAAATLAPAPLSWAHAHVMRAGERGLTTHLAPFAAR